MPLKSSTCNARRISHAPHSTIRDLTFLRTRSGGSSSLGSGHLDRWGLVALSGITDNEGRNDANHDRVPGQPAFDPVHEQRCGPCAHLVARLNHALSLLSRSLHISWVEEVLAQAYSFSHGVEQPLRPKQLMHLSSSRVGSSGNRWWGLSLVTICNRCNVVGEGQVPTPTLPSKTLYRHAQIAAEPHRGRNLPTV